jgi:hypothetical protein
MNALTNVDRAYWFLILVVKFSSAFESSKSENRPTTTKNIVKEIEAWVKGNHAGIIYIYIYIDTHTAGIPVHVCINIDGMIIRVHEASLGN